MKRLHQTVFFILLIVILAIPGMTHAQKAVKLFGVNLECSATQAPSGFVGPVYPRCGPLHFLVLLDVVINFLTKVVVLPVAVLMIIWGGFVIIMSGGNVSKFEQGRKIITTALIGVIISFSASIIIGLIVDLLGPPEILLGDQQGPPLP
jgi:hypothetical protein